MEAPEVFAESHRLAFELLVLGDVDGLRIDHIDGLYDPMEYFRRLQKEYLVALGRAVHGHHGRGPRLTLGRAVGPPPPWSEVEPQFRRRRDGNDLYRLAQAAALRHRGEDPRRRGNLPEQWLLAGTTGYDFLNSVGGLFVNPAGYAEVTKIYTTSSTSGSNSARWPSRRSG